MPRRYLPRELVAAWQLILPLHGSAWSPASRGAAAASREVAAAGLRALIQALRGSTWPPASQRGGSIRGK
jgi:hypothetical protein